jgi:diguanylate cyclase (GGDEF)-like protein/PAS domain S-box-containing protein
MTLDAAAARRRPQPELEAHQWNLKIISRHVPGTFKAAHLTSQRIISHLYGEGFLMRAARLWNERAGQRLAAPRIPIESLPMRRSHQRIGPAHTPPESPDLVLSEGQDAREVLSSTPFEAGSEDLMSRVFASSSQALMVFDCTPKIVAVNEAFSRITGYSAAEAVGAVPNSLDPVHYGEGFFATLWTELSTKGHWEGSLWNRRKSGETYRQILTIDAMRDPSGKATHYVALFSDSPGPHAAPAQIEPLAHSDPITGLPNRQLMVDQLESAILAAKESGTTLAVMLVDLDRFKNINDTLGHRLGDDLLAEVGRRLRAAVREVDLVGRQGGDEYIIVLPEIGRTELESLAHELLAAVTPPYCLAGNDIVIRASAGIACYPEHGQDADRLLRNADAAMYTAKEAGRSNFRHFSRDMVLKVTHRLLIEQDLRLALERRELFLEFQPQYDLSSGKVVGCEALVRWQHPLQGTLYPIDFIDIAEECGLIVALGDFVLEASCAQRALWRDRGLEPGRIAINVSSQQFRRVDFVEKLEAILGHYALDPEILELEVTESVVMHDHDDVLVKIRRLRNLGVKLSIDDFGTGYSSMSYLKQFPLHQLKIDRIFIKELAHDRSSVAIAQAIVGLGHTLGLTVVGEGVETLEQAKLLREMGCDTAQGFLFARPQPGDACEHLLQGPPGAFASLLAPSHWL